MTQIINLSHISPADCLRQAAKAFAKSQAISRAENLTAASRFEVGQVVRSTRRHGADFLTGVIVAINGGNITLDGGRTFKAPFLTAA